MALDFMTQRSLLIEIGQSSLKAFDGNSGLELPLERLESGPLTHSCKENLTSALRRFLQRKNWTQRQRAICAIGARGVSLRRLILPASSKDELQRLLLLQIESEFPLAPEELAWGYCKTGNESPSLTDASGSQELVVVAVKKEVLEEYSEILSGCGLNAIFTLAALARNSICPHPSSPYAILDIGRDQSELISFENGAPSAVRILRWGGEDITRSIATKLGIGHSEAEKLKIDLEHASLSNAEHGPQIQNCIRSELDSLARLIQRNWVGQKLYLTGKTTRLAEISPFLSEALGGGAQCERIESTAGEGRSAAVLGLKRLEQEENGPPLIFQLRRSRHVESTAQPAQWKWAALAVLLAFGSLCLRYAEPFFQKPRLSRKLSEIKTYRDALPRIDKELSFLQFLKTNEPPYLQAISIVAASAGPGTRVESFSMSRRGDLSLRGTMPNSQQATDFRSKLIDSGFFAVVVLEEQTPSPDRQKVTVRITAQCKPADARPSPVLSPSAKELKSAAPPVEPKAGGPRETNATPDQPRTSSPGPEIKR